MIHMKKLFIVSMLTVTICILSATRVSVIAAGGPQSQYMYCWTCLDDHGCFEWKGDQSVKECIQCCGGSDPSKGYCVKSNHCAADACKRLCCQQFGSGSDPVACAGVVESIKDKSSLSEEGLELANK